MPKSPNQTAGGQNAEKLSVEMQAGMEVRFEWPPIFRRLLQFRKPYGRAVSISLLVVSQNHVSIPLVSSNDNTTMRWISPTHHILVDQPDFPDSLWWWFAVLLSFPINQSHHPLFQGVP